MTFWNFILLIGLLSHSFVNSSNFIQQIVKGNLSDPWKFNISLFANELKGMLLYCVDSQQNKLSIKMIVGMNTKKYLQLSYNNVFIRSSLHQICGCDPCDEKFVNITLELNNKIIHLSCNEYGQDTLKESRTKDNIPISILQIIKNQTNSLFIAMGNVDESEGLIGCLKSFYLNKTRIQFKEKGKEFLPSCQVKCRDEMCNGGKCGSAYPFGPICDCSNTALNGRYCRRPLKTYVQRNNTSFIRKYSSNKVQFKLSWKKTSDTTYCLMDLVYKFGHFILTVNEEFLMKDSEVISTINPKGINFINVNFTDSHVMIKSNEKVFVMELPLREKIKINIGFSDVKNKCKLFSGQYDFHFNRTQLEKFGSVDMQTSKINIKWIQIPLLVLLLLFLIVILLLYIRRKSKENENTSYQQSKTGDVNPSGELERLNSKK